MADHLLTKKKKAWLGKFRPTVNLQGAPLRNNAAGAMKYNSALQRLVDQMVDETEKELRKLFEGDAAASHFGQDASVASQARIVTNYLMAKFDQLFNKKSQGLASNMVSEAQAHSKTALNSSLKELSGGLSLKTDIMSTPLAQVVKASVIENVSLIKSIPEQYLNGVTGAVMRSITTGNGLQDLVPYLQKHRMVTKRRATMIAYDQTRKAYGSINRNRMEHIGIKSFKWVHSGGSNQPRPYHLHKWPAGLNGGIFRFDDLPVIDEHTGEKGIPGQAPNCGCTMTPVLQFDDGEEA